VVAIVLAAAWRIGQRTLRNAALWSIAAAAFIALFAFSVPFPFVILGAALVGLVGGRMMPRAFEGGAHATLKAGEAGAFIGDDTPTPAHAHFSPRRLAAIIAVFVGTWAVALGALALAFGWQSDFTQMGWFFTKAALLTFGGAYAVLPYVLEGAVETYGWLTAPQMIDGLALGETTPGPLIMIVAFVGFLGGWTRQLLGPEALLAAGVLGASIATFFTFLPSFLFILAGGPLVESTRDDVKLTAPLTAITAAVVGVIVNLAVYFAWHVFWPESAVGRRFDVASVVIALVAMVALLSRKVDVIPVIAASGFAGWALWALGPQGAV
jgi:chromate transporter